MDMLSIMKNSHKFLFNAEINIIRYRKRSKKEEEEEEGTREQITRKKNLL